MSEKNASISVLLFIVRKFRCGSVLRVQMSPFAGVVGDAPFTGIFSEAKAVPDSANVDGIDPRTYLRGPDLTLELRERGVQHYIQLWRVAGCGALFAFKGHGNRGAIRLESQSEV